MVLAAASGPNGYAKFQWFIGSIHRAASFCSATPGRSSTICWAESATLIWDTGRGFGPQEREWLAAATLIGSITLTVIVAAIGYLAMGGSQ